MEKLETLMILAMAENELAKAHEKHGEKFATAHEAYSVIKEEVEEAAEEMAGIADAVNDMWNCVRKDAPVAEAIDRIYDSALACMEELLQVMAMCFKADDSQSEINGDHDCDCGGDCKCHKNGMPEIPGMKFVEVKDPEVAEKIIDMVTRKDDGTAKN